MLKGVIYFKSISKFLYDIFKKAISLTKLLIYKRLIKLDTKNRT